MSIAAQACHANSGAASFRCCLCTPDSPPELAKRHPIQMASLTTPDLWGHESTPDVGPAWLGGWQDWGKRTAVN